MLGDLWKKWKNARDEKLLAEYQARDAQLGSPTQATLDERAGRAAQKGYWKTAIAAVEQGADVNMAVDRSSSADGHKMEWRQSLALVAIEQDNAVALEQLLARGAKKDFRGGFSVLSGPWAREDNYTPIEYAVREGAKNSAAALLRHGGIPQESLDGALRISAREKSYLGMTEALLGAGAKDFEGAQRAAEIYKNDKAILLIKGAAKKAFAAAQSPAPASSPAPVAAARPGFRM